MLTESDGERLGYALETLRNIVSTLEEENELAIEDQVLNDVREQVLIVMGQLEMVLDG